MHVKYRLHYLWGIRPLASPRRRFGVKKVYKMCYIYWALHFSNQLKEGNDSHFPPFILLPNRWPTMNITGNLRWTLNYETWDNNTECVIATLRRETGSPNASYGNLVQKCTLCKQCTCRFTETPYQKVARNDAICCRSTLNFLMYARQTWKRRPDVLRVENLVTVRSLFACRMSV